MTVNRSSGEERERSRFVEEDVVEEMVRDRQRQALQALREDGGALNAAGYPYWATPEQTSEWAHDLRRQADEHAMWKVGSDHPLRSVHAEKFTDEQAMAEEADRTG